MLKLQIICKANGISLNPSLPNELCEIPVYEDGYAQTLLSLANTRTKTDIFWPSVPDLNYLQAYFKKYKSEDGRTCNKIVVAASNYCWARFYAAKELMHCTTDDDGIPASNTIALVNDLIESVSVTETLSLESRPQTIVDQIAWLGASEYLVPTPWMPMIERLLRDMQKDMPKENSFLQVAQILRVPERVLRSRVSNHHKKF